MVSLCHDGAYLAPQATSSIVFARVRNATATRTAAPEITLTEARPARLVRRGSTSVGSSMIKEIMHITMVWLMLRIEGLRENTRTLLSDSVVAGCSRRKEGNRYSRQPGNLR